MQKTKMNKSTILIGAVATAAIIGLIYWGKPGGISTAPSANSATVALAAAERFYDFGTISMKNGVVSHLFTVTNPTDADVLVKGVVTSCMCTSAYIVDGEKRRGPFGMPGHGGPGPEANEVIKAGESRTSEVLFDPNAHGPAGIGVIDRIISLTDANGATLDLEIKANVIP